MSCIMPVGNTEWRPGFYTFLDQVGLDALEVELIVVTEEHDDYELTSALKDAPNCHNVRQVGPTLGDARNEALALARGEYIAMWDADDHHASTRLADQLDALESSKQKACFLERIVLNDVQADLFWTSHRYPWECTMVARADYVRSFGGWPSLDKGEDTVLMRKMLRTDMVMMDRSDLYTYRYHRKNTWNRDHFDILCGLGEPKARC